MLVISLLFTGIHVSTCQPGRSGKLAALARFNCLWASSCRTMSSKIVVDYFGFIIQCERLCSQVSARVLAEHRSPLWKRIPRRSSPAMKGAPRSPPRTGGFWSIGRGGVSAAGWRGNGKMASQLCRFLFLANLSVISKYQYQSINTNINREFWD